MFRMMISVVMQFNQKAHKIWSRARRRCVKLLNILIILAMLLPNFSAFVQTAFAADSSPDQENILQGSLKSAFDRQHKAELPLPYLRKVHHSALYKLNMAIMPVELILDPEASFVASDGNAFVAWQINGWETISDTQTLELVITVPISFTPGTETSQKGVFNAANHELTLSAPGESDNTQWQIGTATAPYTVTARLSQAGELLSSTTIELRTPKTFLVADSGSSSIQALDGTVSIAVPTGAISVDAYIQVENAAQKELPVSPLSADIYEFTAHDQSTGEEITQFSKPLTITVQYQEEDWAGAEEFISFVYLDEEAHVWKTVPSEVDPVNNVVTAWMDHFTVGGLSPGNSQFVGVTPGFIGAPIDAFGVSLPKGSATYAYEIPLPAGPGGFGPQLTLQYNSGTVNSLIGNGGRDTGWVGIGWTMDLGHMTRNSITLNGVSEKIIRQGATNIYFTEHQSYLRIERIGEQNPQGNYRWIVTDRSGTKYYFGTDASTGEGSTLSYKQTYPNGTCALKQYETYKLYKVVDIHGNTMNINYFNNVVLGCDNVPVVQESYPTEIRYTTNPNAGDAHAEYKINFDISDKGYYLPKFYGDGGYRLDAIRMYYDPDSDPNNDQLIRTVNFFYLTDSSLHTNRLVDLQVSDHPHSSLETDHPYTHFEYEERSIGHFTKQRHCDNNDVCEPQNTDYQSWQRYFLIEASNRYGAQVSYVYETQQDGEGRDKYQFVIQRTVDDTFANSGTYDYIYSDADDWCTSWEVSDGQGNGGYYKGINCNFGNFFGAGTVQVEAPSGLVTKNYFNNDGNGAESNEEPGFLNGYPLETWVYRDDRHLYSVSKTTWTTGHHNNWPGAVHFAFAGREDQYTCDFSPPTWENDVNLDACIHTYSTNVYDDTDLMSGNPTEQKTFFGNGDLYRQTSYEYTSINESSWILGLPYQVQVRDANNVLLSKTLTYYDQQDINHLTTPGEQQIDKGLLTRQRVWAGDDRYIDTTYGDYDDYGNVRQVTAFTDYGTSNTPASGPQMTQTIYGDHHLFPETVINAAGQSISTTYNYLFQVPETVTDLNLVETTSVYDSYGRLAQVTRSDQTDPLMEVYYYDLQIPVKVYARQKIDTNSYSEHYWFYDGFGRLIQERTPRQTLDSGERDIVVDYDYDTSGRLIRQTVPFEVSVDFASDPDGSQQQFLPQSFAQHHSATTYDQLGRTTLIAAPDGTQQTYHYGISGGRNYVQSIDPRNVNWFSTSYSDEWGQVIEVESPAEAGMASVTYGYDPLGRLTDVDQGNLHTEIAYDKAGRKIWMDDPDMGLWEYEYDALGNLLYQDDARDQRICMYYDELDRLTGKAYTDEGAPCAGLNLATTYFYDNYLDIPGFSSQGYLQGQRTGMLDEAGYTVWVYDQLGRVESVTRTFEGDYAILGDEYTFAYTYNIADQVETITYPDGEVVTTEYDDGRPASLRSNLNLSTEYVSLTGYDEAGRLTWLSTGDGLHTLFDYYSWNTQGGRLDYFKVFEGTTEWMKMRYTYDAVGNILSIVDTSAEIGSQTSTFTYDSLSRLKTAQAVGGNGGQYDHATTPYIYDSLGRLETMPGLGDYEFASDHPHAVEKINGNTLYTYDENGNMIERIEDGLTYTQIWNRENKLEHVSWTENGEDYETTFVYDGDGGRLLKIEVFPDGSGGSTELTSIYVGGVYERQVDTTEYGLATAMLPMGQAVARLKQRIHPVISKVAVVQDELVKAYNRPPDELAKLPSSDLWSEMALTWIQEQEYAIRQVEDTYQAPNRAHNLRTYFDTDGTLRIVPRDGTGDWELQWRLTSFGRQDKLAVIGVPAEAHSVDNQFTYKYSDAGLESWYLNTAEGLEQSFMLAARPEGEGPLVIEADTNLTLQGDEAVLLDQDQVKLTYTKLMAWDSEGTPLTSRLETSHQGLRIVVDDHNAVYPITVDPLVQSPAWTVVGEQNGSQLGFSVSSAGDVNGDGYSDVIVGAPYFDTGLNDAGAVFVYHGSSTGLNGEPDWSAFGEQEGAYFGQSVSTAGNINASTNDQYTDVLIGAPGYDFIKKEINIFDVGRAYIFAGSANGLDDTPAWTADGDEAGAQFGYAVSTAGDVNGDNCADIAVGAPLDADMGSDGDEGNEVEGRVFVYYGCSLGTNPDRYLNGEGDGDRFGHAVAGAGDFNGDGYTDLAVGAPLYGSTNEFLKGDDWESEADTGRIYVYYGDDGDLGSTAGWTATGSQANAQFGFAVSAAGDVNGDGHADLIVGAPYYANGQSEEGRVFLYYGTAGSLSITSWQTEGNQVGAHLGISVGMAGDVNGDGYADVIVGADGYDASFTDAGRSLVYIGSASGLGSSPAWSVNGTQNGEALGAAVGAAGDVNGDGYGDVVISAPRYDLRLNDHGRISVYFGGPDELSENATWTTDVSQAGARYGYTVQSAGDLNGDGYAEVVVSAPYLDYTQINSEDPDKGRVYLYCGSANGIPTTPNKTLEGSQTMALFGSTAGSAGDVNGDGYDDLFVGAYLFDDDQTDEGRVYLYHGDPQFCNPDYALLPAWMAEGNQNGAYFGFSVSTAGDTNGDGYSDLIVGAFGEGSTAGAAFLYYGSTNGLSLTPDRQISGQQANAQLGYSVGTVGDVNGDGYSDVVIGAPKQDDAGVDKGRVLVYYGGQTGLNSADFWEVSGNQSYEQLGFAVSAAGDVNGDGYADLLVGANQYNNGGGGEGAAFVFYGSANGPSASSDWSIYGSQANANLGAAVSLAGDVNGDGLSDIVISAPSYDHGQSNEGQAYVYYGSANGLSAAADWTAEGNQIGAMFGSSVSSAGDVDGDGYAEVLVGAKEFDTSSPDAGRAYLYSGGGQDRVSLNPRPRQVDSGVPFANLGIASRQSYNQFRLDLQAVSPFGCGRVRLEMEIKSLGTPFDGTGTIGNPAWTDTCSQANNLTLTVTDLEDYRPYHWRARLVYHPDDFPYLSHGPWVTTPWNGWNEMDFRTSEQTPPISSLSMPTPPDGEHGWYQHNAIITLTAQDTGGIGVARIEYAFGDGCSNHPETMNWIPYEGPFTVKEDDVYFFCHRAYDRVGNDEDPPIQTTFKVDATAPDTTVSPAGIAGVNGWYRGDPLTVTLTKHDNLSGKVELQYRHYESGATPGDWITAVATDTVVTLAGEGEHTLEYQAWDDAGNLEQGARAFYIDASAPLITGTTPAPNALLNETTPIISATLSHSGAGIDWSATGTKMYLDGRQVPESSEFGADSFQEVILYDPAQEGITLAEGTHTVFMQVVDLAGNRSEAVWQFTIDSTTWVEVLTPFDGTTLNQESISLTLATEAGQPITLTLNSALSQTTKLVDNGRLVLDWPLGTEQDTISVWATDEAGNRASTAATLFYQPDQHSAEVYADPVHFAPDPSRVDVSNYSVPERQMVFAARVNPYEPGWVIDEWGLSIEKHIGLTIIVVKTITGTLVQSGDPFSVPPIQSGETSWLVYWNGLGDTGPLEGEYHYHLEATLVQENTTDTETVTSLDGILYVDRTKPDPPQLNVQSHPDYDAKNLGDDTIWFRHATAIWGSADDDSEQIAVYYSTQGIAKPVQLTTDVYANQWLLNLPLTEGQATEVVVTAIDAAGNESESSEAFWVGLSGDQIFTAPAEVYPAVIGGGTTAVLTATVRSGGAPLKWVNAIVPVGPNPPMNHTGSAPQGEIYTGLWHTPLDGGYQGAAVILFQSEDTALEPVWDETIVAPYLDLKPPWVAIHSPANGQFQGTEVLTVTGVAEPYSQIWVEATIEGLELPSISSEAYSDVSGYWQTVITLTHSARYTLRATAIDRVGNLSPADEVEVRIDLVGPYIYDYQAQPYYLNPALDPITELDLTMLDDLTGVSWANGTMHDLPGQGDEISFVFLGDDTDPNLFEYTLTVPANSSEGQKDLSVTAEDWVGNVSENTIAGLVVDVTPPLVGTPWLEAEADSNLYVPVDSPRTVYHGPESGSDQLTAYIEVSDTSETLVTSGVDYVTFPPMLAPGDGDLEYYEGAQTATASHLYVATGYPYSSSTGVIQATDRARNISAPSQPFTVIWDAADPTLNNLNLHLSPDAHAVYPAAADTLYFGPGASGTLTVTVNANDSSSGMRQIEFPALFSTPATTIFGGNGGFGRSYTIVGDAYTDGSFPLIAVDNVGNDAPKNFQIYKDSVPPEISLEVEQSGPQDYQVSWSVSDPGGSGVAEYQVQYRIQGGGWVTWLEGTEAGTYSATFTPEQVGVDYDFRVYARDRVENAQFSSTIPVSTVQVTKYYFFGAQRVAMRKGSDTWSAVYYLHGDHLGSVSLTTDENGSILAQARHLPFGGVRWESGTALTDFGFTGQRLESGFGLMDYNARYYDARLGRFISADTIVPGAGNPMAFDRYAYVNNNPVRYNDPSGHCVTDPFSFFVCAMVGGAIAGAIVNGVKSYNETGRVDWEQVGEGAVGGALITGGVVIAGTAVVTVGSGLLAAGGVATTVGGAVIADGDPTNEITAIANAISADGDPTNEIGALSNLPASTQNAIEQAQQAGRQITILGHNPEYQQLGSEVIEPFQ